MFRGSIAIILIFFCACTDKQYVLTINTIAPDKSNRVETHSVYADNDSAAYAQATVIFFLALHAYKKTAEESKPYVTEPVAYKLTDEQGNNVDSILGAEKTQKIRDVKESLIN